MAWQLSCYLYFINNTNAFFLNISLSDRERHAPCAIVPLKTEMSHRFLQWYAPRSLSDFYDHFRYEIGEYEIGEYE